MRSARILVVTNGPLCRNPRVVKEARTLGLAGYDVTVLAIRNHAPSEPLDRALLAGAPFRREVIDMLPGVNPAACRRRLWLRFARDAAGKLGWKTIRSLGPAFSLLRRVRSLPADLTIVHNEVPHWVGAQLLASGRRIAADFEDWHSEDLLPGDQAVRPLGLIRTTESQLLRQAAYTSTTSAALAAGLHARYGGARPVVLTNSFPLQSAPRVGAPALIPSLLWFSQTIGPGRGLEAFLATWSLTKQPSRLTFVGTPHTGYPQKLLAPLPGHRRHDITFHGLVPPGDLADLIAQHDIGLALEPPEPLNKDLTISNKILQYLNAGLALVATPTSGQREVLSRAPDSGIFLDLSKPTNSATALDALLADRSALAHHQAAARRAAEEIYSWERESPVLLAAVAAALRTSLP